MVLVVDQLVKGMALLPRGVTATPRGLEQPGQQAQPAR